MVRLMNQRKGHYLELLFLFLWEFLSCQKDSWKALKLVLKLERKLVLKLVLKLEMKLGIKLVLKLEMKLGTKLVLKLELRLVRKLEHCCRYSQLLEMKNSTRNQLK